MMIIHIYQADVYSSSSCSAQPPSDQATRSKDQIDISIGYKTFTKGTVSSNRRITISKFYNPGLVSGTTLKDKYFFIEYSSFMRMARGVYTCQSKLIRHNQLLQQMPDTCYPIHLKAFAVNDRGADL